MRLPLRWDQSRRWLNHSDTFNYITAVMDAVRSSVAADSASTLLMMLIHLWWRLFSIHVTSLQSVSVKTLWTRQSLISLLDKWPENAVIRVDQKWDACLSVLWSMTELNHLLWFNHCCPLLAPLFHCFPLRSIMNTRKRNENRGNNGWRKRPPKTPIYSSSAPLIRLPFKFYLLFFLVQFDRCISPLRKMKSLPSW